MFQIQDLILQSFLLAEVGELELLEQSNFFQQFLHLLPQTLIFFAQVLLSFYRLSRSIIHKRNAGVLILNRESFVDVALNLMDFVHGHFQVLHLLVGHLDFGRFL